MTEPTTNYKINKVGIHWLGQATIVLEGSKTVIFDPYTGPMRFIPLPQFKADLLLVTHEHDDHFSMVDVQELTSRKTKLVASDNCRMKLGRAPFESKFVDPGDKVTVDGIQIEAVPAYNIVKDRLMQHPKSDGHCGYIVTLDKITFYHASDTDFIPEMKSIKADVVFLPIGGSGFTMDAKEAAQAVKAMKPKVAIPIHYDNDPLQIAPASAAQDFAKMVGDSAQVVILKKE